MKKTVILLALLAFISVACSSQNNAASDNDQTSLGHTGAATRLEALPVERVKNLDKATPTPTPSLSEDSISETNSEQTEQSFAFQSVKWNNVIYRLTNEEIEEVDSEIGEIENFSNIETYEEPGNNSNFLREGTKIWSVKGIDISDAIAIKVDKDVYRLLRAASNKE